MNAQRPRPKEPSGSVHTFHTASVPEIQNPMPHLIQVPDHRGTFAPGKECPVGPIRAVHKCLLPDRYALLAGEARHPAGGSGINPDAGKTVFHDPDVRAREHGAAI